MVFGGLILTNKFNPRIPSGIFLLNSSDNVDGGNTPIFYSCPLLTKVLSQSNITGNLTNDDRQDTSISYAGTWINLNANNSANSFIIFPNYGICGYADSDYGGTILINFKNRTNYPVIVNCPISNSCSSVKVFYHDILLVKT